MKHLLLSALLLASVPALAQQKPAVKSVVGKWVNCRQEYGANVIIANVCPTITLLADGTGCITAASQQVEAFTWQQAGNKLLVRNNAPPDPVLASGEYTITERTTKQYSPVLLLTTSAGTTYVLIKAQ